MATGAMKRSDLSWALSAVIPHAGRKAPFDFVGLTYRAGTLYAWASDGYTAGVARVDAGMNGDLDVRLVPSEAAELERFVRPGYKAEEEGLLSYAAREGEFHVGFERQVHRDGTTEDDSGVFETVQSVPTLDLLLSTAERFYAKPRSLAGLIFQPQLAAKFAKAQRAEFERLVMYPCETSLSGAAVLTIGSDFLGIISGLTESPEPATVASFLTALERGAAA